MKRRRLKGWVKDLLAILIIYIFSIAMILLLCARAEEIDQAQKKELPVATQSNSTQIINNSHF